MHLPALDGLRGVAILLVLVCHTLQFDVALSPFGTLRSFLANLLISSGFGVQLFFVLSGFLITGILLDEKQSPNYFKNFFGRRILRIFPLYYGVIFASWAFLWLSASPHAELFCKRLPWLLTYTQNLLIAKHNDWSFIFGELSLGHFWSLAVEEQFYLLWPFLVLRSSQETLKRLCWVAIPVALALRCIFTYGYENILGAFVFMPCQLDSLSVGALLAIMVREDEVVVKKLAKPLICAGACVWIISCLDMKSLITIGMTAFSVMSAGILSASLYSQASKPLSNTVLRSFGKYSYAIYVFHVPLLSIIFPLREHAGRVCFASVFFLASYLVGWTSWRCIEVYFLRFKPYFASQHGRPWTPRLPIT